MKKLILAVLIICAVAVIPVFSEGQKEASEEYSYVLGKVPYTFEHA